MPPTGFALVCALVLPWGRTVWISSILGPKPAFPLGFTLVLPWYSHWVCPGTAYFALVLPWAYPGIYQGVYQGKFRWIQKPILPWFYPGVTLEESVLLQKLHFTLVFTRAKAGFCEIPDLP